MLNYPTYQLITIILLKHLYRLNAVWEDKVIFNRIYELDEEYEKIPEYQELTEKQQQLLEQLFESDAKEQRREALLEFDSLKVRELTLAKKLYYLAGIKDALQIFNVS
jgi:hypothetical protein